MGELDVFTSAIAAHQIRERVERKRRSHVPGQRQRRIGRSGRHALARGLHGLADRLDT